MLTAPQRINPVIHATVFKAANVNTRPLPGSARAEALLNRWLDDELSVRDAERIARLVETTPEHIF